MLPLSPNIFMSIIGGESRHNGKDTGLQTVALRVSRKVRSIGSPVRATVVCE